MDFEKKREIHIFVKNLLINAKQSYFKKENTFHIKIKIREKIGTNLYSFFVIIYYSVSFLVGFISVKITTIYRNEWNYGFINHSIIYVYIYDQIFWQQFIFINEDNINNIERKKYSLNNKQFVISIIHILTILQRNLSLLRVI